eukprot:scaffold67836_cov18-Tisochrysis_lutea.AAC.1
MGARDPVTATTLTHMRTPRSRPSTGEHPFELSSVLHRLTGEHPFELPSSIPMRACLDFQAGKLQRTRISPDLGTNKVSLDLGSFILDLYLI